MDCANQHEATHIAEYLEENLYNFAAAWKAATGQDRKPAPYLVVSDDHPPVGAHVEVLINFRAPAVATYAARIHTLLATSASHVIVVTLAASALASANKQIKWHQLPTKETVPKMPKGMQRVQIANASSFVGHMSMNLNKPAALAFLEHLNLFEKPCELAAIEKAGVFFQQIGD